MRYRHRVSTICRITVIHNIVFYIQYTTNRETISLIITCANRRKKAQLTNIRIIRSILATGCSRPVTQIGSSISSRISVPSSRKNMIIRILSKFQRHCLTSWIRRTIHINIQPTQRFAQPYKITVTFPYWQMPTSRTNITSNTRCGYTISPQPSCSCSPAIIIPITINVRILRRRHIRYEVSYIICIYPRLIVATLTHIRTPIPARYRERISSFRIISI